jgi:Tol biopolymer transport system component
VPALGGTARRVTGCGGTPVTSLSWSPDGRLLAFSIRPERTDPFRVVLFEIESGARRELTAPDALAEDDINPAFSPDGRWVSFLRRRSAGIEDLYVVPVEGGEPRRLTADDRYIAGYDWMPDGRHLVFSSNRSGNFGLWRVPASGGAPSWFPVSGLYDPGAPTFPRTPGATAMAYVEWFFDYNLWQQPLAADRDAAGEPRQQIGSTQWERHPHVAPGGTRIAFMSNRTGHNEIWVNDTGADHPVRLTSFEGDYVGVPRWSPDGQRIAFEARLDAHTAIFIINGTGGPPRQLTDAGNDAFLPS